MFRIEGGKGAVGMVGGDAAKCECGYVLDG